jgi:hypothetical protein
MKTSELTGAALDWAVAKCEGEQLWIGSKVCERICPDNGEPVFWEPSTEWAQGGPIIERERTEFDFDEDTQMFHAYDGVYSGVGQTHLIAAMRCYVASKLGDDINIPEELT